MGRPRSSRRRLLALALVLALPTAACGGAQDAAAAPAGEADVEGEVRDVTQRGDGGVAVLIVPAGDPCGVWTAVDANDRLFFETESGVEERDVTTLERGQLARAWLDTPIAESCPGQAGASDVVVSDETDWRAPAPSLTRTRGASRSAPDRRTAR